MTPTPTLFSEDPFYKTDQFRGVIKLLLCDLSSSGHFFSWKASGSKVDGQDCRRKKSKSLSTNLSRIQDETEPCPGKANLCMSLVILCH